MRIDEIVCEFRTTVEWVSVVIRSEGDCDDRADEMDRVVWSKHALATLRNLAREFRDAYRADNASDLPYGWKDLAQRFILGVQGHGVGLWDMGHDIEPKIPSLIRAERDNRAEFYCWAGPRARIARMEEG